MKLKKLLSVLLMMCFFVNVSFAFDPYADEEVEKKSYKKLYYGIVLTLLGGFLAYDGFSEEKVDVSKPSVDAITVSHSEWVQRSTIIKYEMRSGISLNNAVNINTGDFHKYKINSEDSNNSNIYSVEPNVLYNSGNVDLKNLTIEVRYRCNDGTYILDEDETNRTTDGYHIARVTRDSNPEGAEQPSDNEIKTYTYKSVNPEDPDLQKLVTLKKGESLSWQDILRATTELTNSPSGNSRNPYVSPDEGEENPGTTGLNLGKDSGILMDVRVILNKYQNYEPIYEKRHKSDLEGVAGILIGITGIYFIVDHFLDMNKFNTYARKHNLNLKVATASNEYKLMLQKRI